MNRFRTTLIRAAGIAVVSAWTAAAALAGSNVSLPRLPSLSPDGRQLAFSWRGDLWLADSAGGAARRLTSNPADELLSAFSNDGKQIAFTSSRNGYQDLYLVNADGTGLAQIVNLDRALSLWDFTTDHGKPVIAFSGRLELDEFPGPRSYAIGVNGGDPARLMDAFGANPSISPDGKKILFTRGSNSWLRRNYRGPDARDVWLYDRTTQAYTQITTWNGNDGRARWVDNESFIFASDRADDCVNLYRLNVGQTENQARRLTDYKDADVEDFDISADGKTLVFARWDKLYRVDIAAGTTAEELSLTADEDTADRQELKSVDRAVTETVLSPDGKAVAIVSYGQLYVRGVGAKSPARRITRLPARHMQAAWSPDGEKLYFAGDEGGQMAVYAATVKINRAEVKKQIEQLNAPATAATTDESPAAAAAAPTTAAATIAAATTQPASQSTTSDSAAGEVKSAKEAKDKDKPESRWTDAIAFAIEPVIRSNDSNTEPSPSPDGKWLAFRRGLGQLWLREIETGDEQKIFDGWSEQLEWRWSPDSLRIAYATEDVNNNSDIWIAPIDQSSPAVNISRHPDNDGSPRWSADGKILAFLSNRVNNENDVWTVALDKSLENLTPAELEKYFEDTNAAVKKREPLKGKKSSPATTKSSTTTKTAPAVLGETGEGDRGAVAAATSPATSRAMSRPTTRDAEKDHLDLDDAYLRVRRLTAMPGDERDLELAPAGDRILFTAQAGGRVGGPPAAARATFTVDTGGGEPKRVAGNLSIEHLSLTGDKAAVVEGNRAAAMKIPAGEIEYFDVADKLLIDLPAQSAQKFLEAARTLGMVYYDPTMHGLDWPAVTKKYLALAGAAVTADEFDHVANRFIGELNGSHLGINTPEPRSDLAQPMGRLGIQRKRVADGYEVTDVFPQGPAGKGAMKLEIGDVILEIEGAPFEPSDTLESRLQGRVGLETLFTIRRGGAAGEQTLQLLITPISSIDESAVFYDEWRTRTARKVAEMSGGAMGYIHIRGMDQNSLDVFERDLYAAADGKKGLIIDVRNNGGGWTADRLLAAIMYPRHAYTRPRGVSGDVTDAYPNDRLFITRYDLPTNMLCNERSFSNAEIIAHAFKTLKRGTLVGQQTAGGVISTGGTTLIDGTTVRLPGRGWFTPDGKNMELNGAMPDVIVKQTPEAEAARNDEQLKAAVDDLMKRVR